MSDQNNEQNNQQNNNEKVSEVKKTSRKDEHYNMYKVNLSINKLKYLYFRIKNVNLILIEAQKTIEDAQISSFVFYLFYF
jgi:hypothetical protein